MIAMIKLFCERFIVVDKIILVLTTTSVPAPSGASSSTSTVVSFTPTRLGTMWKSIVWDYFTIAEDNMFAKCSDCRDLVSRGSDS